MFAHGPEVLIPCKAVAYGHALASERMDTPSHNGNSGPIMVFGTYVDFPAKDPVERKSLGIHLDENFRGRPNHPMENILR
jgi:hypothetical protein